MGMCARYDNVTWLLYARGYLDSGVAAEMRAHSESCSECRDWLGFCRTIGPALELNSSVPSESWVEEAVEAFKSLRPDQVSSDPFGELVYDSYLHDGETVRSPGLAVRHLIFDLPGFDIDLVLEYSGRQLKSVIGHFLSKVEDSPGMSPAFSVELRAGDRVYFTTANTFGEFLFTVDAPITGEPLELRCPLVGGQCAIVLIPC